ncbi:MAG: tetratricopeptide repeat protein [Candidatus Aminicenantes bacterium]|nr:tetratricopeptide repeat protein [Candidatus Aminicenantes bacterium]NIQ69087.1 tetratricopeptide repeat protein [Candidatus Aminicenantes bacterium]NIR09083.1 tetratricopeptide repeat protein [Candidatus Aminicenantes bacterium]
MIRKSIIFLLWVFFCFHYCLGKGAVLRGYITFQNSGNPVPGVNVKASAEANADVTDNFGMFELLFAKNNPGDMVTLILEKPGLEVVKREGEELRFVLRSNPDELVRVVMRKIGEGARLEREYSGIAREAINKNYELLKENIQLKSDIKEKDKEIAKLTAQRDAALAQVEDAAKTFAAVDLDQASRLYKEAFAYFKKGDIDKALETLDDAKIEEAVRQAQEEKRKADEAIKKNADNYRLKAQLFIIKLRFEQAENYFKKAIRLDPDNIYNVGTYANFLLDQNQFHKALPLYKKTLSLQVDEYNRAVLLNNLGTLYSHTSRFTEAENAYNKALLHYRELAKHNPNAYLPYVATSLHNLGLFYGSSKRYSEAVKALNEALEIREKLAKDNPTTFNVGLCSTLIAISLVYSLTSNEESMQSNSKETLSMLNRAISILKKYQHVPKAQDLLEIAKEYKEILKKVEKEK